LIWNQSIHATVLTGTFKTVDRLIVPIKTVDAEVKTVDFLRVCAQEDGASGDEKEKEAGEKRGESESGEDKDLV
jgi:hypothetical protein